jgi:hypothetical protein
LAVVGLAYWIGFDNGRDMAYWASCEENNARLLDGDRDREAGA